MSRPGYFAERRAARLAAGLCAMCGQAKHEKHRSRCTLCAERVAMIAKEHRSEARSAGKCIICLRRKATTKKTTCTVCRKDAAARMKVRGHVEPNGLRTKRG